MDFNMPVMEGVTSTKEILKLLYEKKKIVGDSAAFDIIVIGFSAYNDAYHVKTALKAGMVKVLNKPTNRDAFVDCFFELGLL